MPAQYSFSKEIINSMSIALLYYPAAPPVGEAGFSITRLCTYVCVRVYIQLYLPNRRNANLTKTT